MAQLAILGHLTRGNEVIEILEMLGGKNFDNYKGNENSWYYIIRNNEIDWCRECIPESNFISFTLEWFLEKFPYKVGDKVTHNMEILMNIVHMFWDAECNVIRYDIQSPVDNNYKLKAMLAEHLQPYKEETMKEKDEKSANHVFDTEIISFDIAKRDKYELDLQGKFDVKLREGKYYVERIKPQYPKTYKECCEVLGLNTMDNDAQGYKGDLIIRFQELLIARDAYWKIAGEKMGLGEPWKPDWNSANSKKSILYTCGNIIHTGISLINNYILAFPTEEMRDAFYENFKELIEGCKELLW